jgi:DUF4097 and DUF4098 domain-containing protein YvlB
MRLVSGCRVRLTVGAVAMLLAGTACVAVNPDAPYTEREEKVFAVTGSPQVTLSTSAGSIEIQPSEEPEMRLVVEKRAHDKESAAAIEVHTEQQGNRIDVDIRPLPVDRIWGFGWDRWRETRVSVSLPASSRVDARSRSGSIHIERMMGSIELHAGSGAVRVREQTGSLNVDTRSGSISLDGVSGPMVVETGSGSIRGRELAGGLNVHTRSGSIELDGFNGSIAAETASGSIIVAGRLTSVDARSRSGFVSIEATPGSATTGKWDIATGSGGVALTLPAGFGGELDANTRSGRVDLHDVPLLNLTEGTGSKTVRGRIGPGGGLLRVRARSGSIRLRTT